MYFISKSLKTEFESTEVNQYLNKCNLEVNTL